MHVRTSLVAVWMCGALVGACGDSSSGSAGGSELESGIDRFAKTCPVSCRDDQQCALDNGVDEEIAALELDVCTTMCTAQVGMMREFSKQERYRPCMQAILADLECRTSLACGASESACDAEEDAQDKACDGLEL